jgi:hypothetical protein
MCAAYRAEFIASGASGRNRRKRDHAKQTRGHSNDARSTRRIAPITAEQNKLPSGIAMDTGETSYNLGMIFVVFAMRLLEVLFFVGLAGSAVVVLISFIEDGKELIGKDEPAQPRA